VLVLALVNAIVRTVISIHSVRIVHVGDGLDVDLDVGLGVTLAGDSLPIPVGATRGKRQSPCLTTADVHCLFSSPIHCLVHVPIHSLETACRLPYSLLYGLPVHCLFT
jgi:hypothetical protein